MLGPGLGWPLSGAVGVAARAGPGSSAVEERVAAAAITGENTSLSVSLKLGSAEAGMSGLGKGGSSSWWKEVVGRTLGPRSAWASQGNPSHPAKATGHS